MKPSTAYTYIVAAQNRRTEGRWALSIQLPNGALETLTAYRTLRKAVSAARTLAYGSGRVEVRA